MCFESEGKGQYKNEAKWDFKHMKKNDAYMMHAFINQRRSIIIGFTIMVFESLIILPWNELINIFYLKFFGKLIKLSTVENREQFSPQTSIQKIVAFILCAH